MEADHLDVLRRCMPRASYSDEVVAALAEHCFELDIARGTVLVSEGEPVTEVYVLLEGRIELRRTPDPAAPAGPGVLLDVTNDGNGNFNGDAGRSPTATCTAVTLSHATVLVVPLPDRATG
jgi:CRP-like cAMP-binding protein